jgi:hypothetical protein
MKRTNHHLSLTPSEAAALRELAGEIGRGNMSATVGTLVERELARIRTGATGETTAETANHGVSGSREATGHNRKAGRE